MALLPCRECGRDVSSEAQACPHCGVPKPTSQTDSSEEGWYFLKGEEKVGPISRSELRELLSDGLIEPQWVVWRDGLENWVPPDTIPGLVPARAHETAPRAHETPSPMADHKADNGAKWVIAGFVALFALSAGLALGLAIPFPYSLVASLVGSGLVVGALVRRFWGLHARTLAIAGVVGMLMSTCAGYGTFKSERATRRAEEDRQQRRLELGEALSDSLFVAAEEENWQLTGRIRNRLVELDFWNDALDETWDVAEPHVALVSVEAFLTDQSACSNKVTVRKGLSKIREVAFPAELETKARALTARLRACEEGIIATQQAAEEERRRQEAQAKRERERALARMRKTHDSVKGVTWYRDPSSPRFVNSRSAIFLYIGDRETGAPWMRLSINYVAEDWLFIEKYTIKADEETFTISPGYGEIETDNSTTIWEWYDTTAGPRELRIARAIANADEVVIRYEGSQYYRDRVVRRAEKTALRNVLNAFEALQGESTSATSRHDRSGGGLIQ